MKKFRLGLGAMCAFVFAVAIMVLATPAGAFHSKNPSRNDQFRDSQGTNQNFHGFDPMETSVPYVAWRGEEIRLVKCFDDEYFRPMESGEATEGGLVPSQPGTIFALEPNETGEWQIMDWSGDPHVWPKFFDDHDQQTQVFFPTFGDQRNRGCFAIDITSHKPGIAIVKLKVDDETNGVLGEGDPSATHQFNVIWMALEPVRLRNLGPGNPLGPVTEFPGDRNQLGLVVQGRIPLNEEFETELGLADPLIFPEDYPALAGTSLAHISWPLQKANNGFEGDDNFRNPTCDDVRTGATAGNETGVPATNDVGSLANPDATACDTDVTDPPFEPATFVNRITYVPEPRHVAGDFWDIHDSTGPYNTGVYGPGKPLIADFCPGPETATPRHDSVCHVDQHDAADNPTGAGTAQPGDNIVENFVGRGGDEDCDDTQVAGGPNTGPAATRNLDTVDNCDPGEFDSFSRVFHDTSGEDGEPTIGPFSPTRPDETLLSDSQVNAHDAPMPAALVLVSIAPNTGGTDIGGVGFLTADKDKHEEYNRGGPNCVAPDNTHCVTAPFSAAYIPPSPTMEINNAQNVPDRGDAGGLDDDRDVASGIHGSIANNFNGYLPVFYPARGQNPGLYHFWDLVDRFRTAVGRPLPPPCEEFSTPSGDQEIAVYTDEHGEARLHFNAGFGVFPGALDVDEVQEACVAEGVIGRAVITANARYPFQPTTSAGSTSNAITKVVESLFNKGIICVPKPGEEDDKAICIVFGRNFRGDPVTGEEVCVNVEGQTTASGNVGSVSDLNNEPDSEDSGDNEVCVILDSPTLPDALADLLDGITGPLGAGCEIPPLDELDTFAWEAVLIDAEGALEATARFMDENLEFDCDFSIPPAGGTQGASIGAAGGNGNGAAVNPTGGGLRTDDGFLIVRRPGGGTTPTGGSSANGSPNNGNGPASKSKVQRRASILFVRIVKPLKLGGVRYVVVRVKSPQKNAKLQVKLIGKRGKVLGTVLRKVNTNRTLRVPNLRLPSAVVTVRAKLIA